MSAILNPHSETEAKSKVEAIIPDPMIRRIGLKMMADAILFANDLGRGRWAVTNTDKPDRLRLQVGHYIVFTLEGNRIWLALDKQLADTPIRENISFLSANGWGWQPDKDGFYQYMDKRKPGNPFSYNGYYRPVSEELHAQIYPEIKRLHFEFLYKAAYVGQSIHKSTQDSHLPGALMYLRNELSKHVPDPSYIHSSE